MKRLRKNVKSVDFRSQKTPHLLSFRHSKNFSRKRAPSLFCVYFCVLLIETNETMLRKRRYIDRRTDRQDLNS